MTQGPKVSLRKAGFGDIEFLFNLRNQPYVYQYARSNRPVEREEHIAWAEKAFSSETNKELFIIQYDKEPAGQLRLDYSGKQAEVSISLLKEFHGKSIAAKSLALALDAARADKKATALTAEVHKDNTASQRLFEKVGFKLRGREGDWLTYLYDLYDL